MSKSPTHLPIRLLHVHTCEYKHVPSHMKLEQQNQHKMQFKYCIYLIYTHYRMACS
jgi:hypothetical protein